jgi:hypothetical protein
MYRMTQWVPVSNNGRIFDAIRLEPEPGTNVFGRHSFMIHGDNQRHNGTASTGCIIIDGAHNRLRIWQSGVHRVMVR